MKVKIKKEGKTKEFKLINSWAEVNLDTWLKLIDFHSGTKSKEAEETIAALSNIPKDLINQLELKDVAIIMNKISELQVRQDSSLKRVNDIEKSLPELCAILYRPIIEETDSGVYTIEAYDGNISIRAEEMKKMSAEQVQSALVFFWAFANVLLMTLESFLIMVQKETKMQ